MILASRPLFAVCATFVLAARIVNPAAAVAGEPAQPKSRSFRLDYGATLADLPAGSSVRVWVPMPHDTKHQTISDFKKELPAEPRIGTEEEYGNRMLYFETKAPASGEVKFDLSWRVERQEVLGLSDENGTDKLTDKERKRLLQADQKVPVGGKSLSLLEGLELPAEPLDLGRALYDRVEQHMKYDKSRPGFGSGDSDWACDSRFGNCTDFHSLFISLARANKLPARFEIGFPLPPERGRGEIGGYHCWAMFHTDEHGWVPVDISEADKHPDLKTYYFGNLTEDRVTFSVGRDIRLVPKQAGEPLNFFVYPYVEVDGKPWPQDKISKRFGYEDAE